MRAWRVVRERRLASGETFAWLGAWPRVAQYIVAPQPAAVRLASAFMSNRPPERPRLFVDRSVLGYRLPSVSRRTASATGVHTTSQRAGVCPCSAVAGPGSRLLIAMSVSGCRLPRVSRHGWVSRHGRAHEWPAMAGAQQVGRQCGCARAPRTVRAPLTSLVACVPQTPHALEST